MSSAPNVQIADPGIDRIKRLERHCTQFESAWKSGQPPRLVQYIEAVPAAERTELLRELLGVDEHYRRAAGDNPTEFEYVAQFPDYAATIREHFAAEFATPVLARTARPASRALPHVPGYAVERELGRGGMGVVYLAQQDRPRRQVVLKMIRDGALAHPDLAQRFHNESEAIARLQHPNIVHVYAVGEHEGRPFMVLEYIAGGGLDRQLDGKPIVPRVAAKLIEQLARAVHYAHQQGVIHRDLKPANILVASGQWLVASGRQTESANSLATSHQPPATVKIADFGLAKLLESEHGPLTMTGDTLGTPSYMAPEQARGQSADIGPATDVYALGAILYQLLTGRPPFLGPNAVTTLEQLTTLDPVPPRQLQPQVPRNLNTICLKCLEKAPERRYATAEELADDLRRYQVGEPIRAHPVGAVERAVRWSRRHPAVALLIGGFFIGVVGLTLSLIVVVSARKNEQVARQHSGEAAEQSLVFLAEDQEMVRRGLYDLRGRALEAAIRLVEQLQTQTVDDPDLMYKLARAYYELGRVHEALGRFSEALAATNQAVVYFQHLADRKPDAYEHRVDLVQCMNQRAKLYGFLLQFSQAEQEFAQAATLISDMHQHQPDDARIYFALAENSLYQAGFYTRAEASLDPKQARATLQRAGDEVTAGLKLAPDNVAGLRTAAIIWQRCVTMTRFHAELTERERELHHTAIARLQQLAHEHPSDCEIQVELGKTHFILSNGHGREGRFLEAEDHARRAVTLIERLTREFPKVLTYRWRLALCNTRLAEVLEKQDRIPEAAAAYQQAVPLVDAEFFRVQANQSTRDLGMAASVLHSYLHFLIRHDRLDDALRYIEKAERIQLPAVVVYEWEPGFVPAVLMMMRATIHDLRGQYQESKAAWDRAEAIDAKTQHLRRRVGRCLALAGLGEVDQAISAANGLASEKDIERQEFFDLARAIGRCCQKSPVAGRQTELAQSAIECLQKARQLGYFRAPIHVSELQSNPDLAPFRDRPDFIALVDAVTKPLQ